MKRSCTVGTPARAMRPTHGASGSTAYRPSDCGQAANAAGSAASAGIRPKSRASSGQCAASNCPLRSVCACQARARHSASMAMKPRALQACSAAR
ncbi:hypothetical protein D3C85_1470370 [compost metagenome]